MEGIIFKPNFYVLLLPETHNEKVATELITKVHEQLNETDESLKY